MDVFNTLIRTRRSVRKFKQRAVEPQKVDLLLKAALLAPSGKRMYPCDFIFVDDTQKLNAISKAKTHGAAFVKEAPMAIVVVADTAKYDVWVEDASIASSMVMLQAENLGLGCCWVQMHLRGTADGKTAAMNLKKELNLADNYDILSVLAIGYADEVKPAYTDDELKYEKAHLNKMGEVYKFEDQ